MDLFEKTKSLKLVRALEKENLYPFLRIIDESKGANVKHLGEDMIMMGSNNYLDLTHHSDVINKAKAAIEEWGTGCTGSRFLNGNLAIHQQMEKKLAKFFGYEDALIFASGFLANQGAISAICNQDDIIFSDEENHACIIEGCQLSKAQIVIYKHNDMKDLEYKLSKYPQEVGKLIISDGVFSMTGHIAKYDQIHRLAEEYGARTYIDDAHGVGTIGVGGRGTGSYYGLKPDMMMGTFSKTLAAQGGFVCARKDVIEWIKLKGRTFMFSAALSPANTAASLAALDILMNNPELVTQLQDKAYFLKSSLDRLGYNTMGSQTAIVPVFIGDDQVALGACHELLKQKIFTTPVVYPAVPPGHALLRLSVMTGLSQNELQKVVDVFAAMRGFILKKSDKPKMALHKFLDSGNLNELSL
jgi:8-amino-7-oxononanoate synthase